MSPYLFDLIVIVLVLLSAGLGFLRGFCNEIFTIFGWIGAVVATILLTPVSRPFLREHIKSPIIADLSTASAIFIITMIAFSVISHYTTKSLQHSKLNAVDRSLGFGFGILRAVLLLGLAFLLVAWMWAPEDRPEMIQKAKTRPLLELAAHSVQFILPGDATIDIDGTDKDDALKKVMHPKDDDRIETDDKTDSKDDAEKDKATSFTAPEHKTDDVKPADDTKPSTPKAD